MGQCCSQHCHLILDHAVALALSLALVALVKILHAHLNFHNALLDTLLALQVLGASLHKSYRIQESYKTPCIGILCVADTSFEIRLSGWLTTFTRPPLRP